MNEKQVLEAMGAIDPALIQEASVPVRRREKRGRLRPVWIAAACLCLVLSGTALAAQLPAISQMILRVLPGGEESGYTVAGGTAYFPMDSLSEELCALAEGHPGEVVGRSFATWEELEAFIGRNLQDNPVLEAAQVGKQTRIEGAMGPYVARISGDAGGLRTVWLSGGYYLHGEPDSDGGLGGTVSILVQGALYTERMEGADDWEYQEGRFYVEGTELEREGYVTPGGLEAELLQIQRPEGKEIEIDGEMVAVKSGTDYVALFSLNGVRYTVQAECDDDPALAFSTLKEVLDGFVVE